jgi:hypothetical protein
MRGWGHLGVVLALSAVAAGCNPFAPRNCTLIGCQTGLQIHLIDAPEELYTVTVTAGDRTESYTCTVAARCPLPFFVDFTPSEVTVVYESDSARVERTFTPEYRRLRPNGDDCPPDCWTATVEFLLT